MEQELYERWKAALELDKSRQKSGGIGTLSEKPLHAAIKYTVEPNDSYHEVRIGSHVADVVTEQGIVEVQTRNFFGTKKKLEAFLQQGPVQLIYPIAETKWICWVDEDSGEVSPPKRSPKKGKPLDSFMELMRIRQLLLHPNLTFQIWMLEVEEYRFLNGYGKEKKKRATRYQQRPLELKEIYSLHGGADYLSLLPDLPQPFTKKELMKAAKRSEAWARYTLYTLEQLELLQRCGKEGKAILYRFSEEVGREAEAIFPGNTKNRP